MNEVRTIDENSTTVELAGSGDGYQANAPGETTPSDRATPLFAPNEAGELRSRWDSIQAGFVDEPRRAVQQADELVDSAIKKLTDVFGRERSKLEQQWDRGGDVSTEDLRVTLQRYRSFFTRLLAV